MLRAIGLVCLLASTAAADDSRAFHFEVGVNTRHFTPDRENVAFRTTTDPSPDPSLEGGNGMTMSLRFTGRTRYNTYLGVEGEAGKMIGLSESNIAGAYGVAGARGQLGRLRLAAELVAGKRWVRYEFGARSDPSAMIMEPRVRGDLWVASQFSIGGAVGSTLSDRAVWMAGLYITFHSNPFDR